MTEEQINNEIRVWEMNDPTLKTLQYTEDFEKTLQKEAK
jgi:hypothetical protein